MRTLLVTEYYGAFHKVADSRPNIVNDFINLPNLFSRTRPWKLLRL
jgi:hypothetical protein